MEANAPAPCREPGTAEWARRRIAECAVLGASLGRTVVPVGPFRACLDPSTDLIWLNYVVPVWALGPSADSRAQLASLRSIFREHNRRLRFEFIDGIWPTLIGELESFGLERQACVPLMWCLPSMLRPVSRPDLDIELLDPSAETAIREFHGLQARAFGSEDTIASQAEIEQRQHQIENEFWRCAVARLDGRMAGVATLVVTDSVCELAGVATEPEFRRRGIASALSSYLMSRHFEDGGDLVWLSAADDAARNVYQLIGFDTIGLQYHYIDP